MPIRTSANTYSRGVPKESQANFYYVAQANNVIPQPMSVYLKNYQFYNRTTMPMYIGR